MNWQFWLLVVIIVLGMVLSVYAKKLTPAAALTGGLTAVCIFAGTGFTGIVMLAAFFLLGTVATSWRAKQKRINQISEDNNGQRKASQVIANAGMAAIMSVLIYFFPEKSVLFSVMAASAFSSATADTLSSELGNVYGRRYYNVLTFRKDTRGLDGVVSREGTLAGICGSIFIALIYAAGFGWNGYLFFVIILSGTIGNVSDSLLGAAFERKGILQNDAVNFLNTLIAALAAWLFF